MDDCLEAARYLHVQACGSVELSEDTEDVAADNIVTADNITADNTEDYQTYDQILDEMFGLNASEASIDTTTTAEEETEASHMIDINKYRQEFGLDNNEEEVKTGQFGVIFNGHLNLCNCSSELPEKILLKILMKNKYWNGLYSKKRTSAYKELERNVEKELQLLLISAPIQISTGRDTASAKNKIELDVDKFVGHGRYTAVMVKINLTESHFDNTLRMESNFRLLAEKYNTWNGTGVFNKTFKGYSKNDYDPKLISVFRVLPKEAAMAKKVVVVETETDPMEKIR